MIAAPPTLQPYPFQVDAINFLERYGGRALLGDEMGIGKTIEALLYLKRHPELRPVVIVCPAVVKWKWQEEVTRWTGEEAVVLSGRGGREATDDWVILNYDIAWGRLAQLAAVRPRAIVIDEVHFVKDQKSQRAKAMRGLSRLSSVQAVMGLSGTPMMNRPWELWHPLHLIRPDKFPNWWAFAYRYCGAHKEAVRFTGGGGATRTVFKYDGQSNTPELVERLRTVMIRRRKADVLRDLPAKTRVTIPVQISGQAYKKLEREVLGEVRAKLKMGRSGLPVALAELAPLRQATGIAKMEAAQEFIDDAPENGPLVVFAHHRAVTQGLHEANRRRSSLIIGGDIDKQRQDALASFKSGRTPLLIVSTRAGGVGIDLTEADTSLTVELDYNPAQHLQAEDRLHRIGQAKPVFAYYLVAQNSIDAPMINVLEKKAKMVSETLTDPETEFVTELATWLEARN